MEFALVTRFRVYAIIAYALCTSTLRILYCELISDVDSIVRARRRLYSSCILVRKAHSSLALGKWLAEDDSFAPAIRYIRVAGTLNASHPLTLYLFFIHYSTGTRKKRGGKAHRLVEAIKRGCVFCVEARFSYSPSYPVYWV